MVVPWKLFSPQSCGVFVSTSLRSGVYLWVDEVIFYDLNLHLYVSMEFLKTPQLVCVLLFLRKNNNLILKRKVKTSAWASIVEKILGRKCKYPFWQVFFFKELTHQRALGWPTCYWGSFRKKTEMRLDYLRSVCTHRYRCECIWVYIIFLEGPLPGAILRTFSAISQSLNKIGDSILSIMIV